MDKKLYNQQYREKNREKIRENSRRFKIRHKEERRLDHWGHYSKGRVCEKCKKKIVNATRGKICKICRLTKDTHVDLKSIKYRLKNPEKYKVRQKLFSHVAQGKIKRLPCGVCGNTKSEAHHEDYKKPLVVLWLCRKHHLERHGGKF